MSDNNDSNQSTSNGENPNKVALLNKADLSLGGDLNISDYVQDLELNKKTAREVCHWSSQHRETTRTKLVLWLVRTFSLSVTITFVLLGVAAFNPKADRSAIKDLVSLGLTPQLTLLGVALGFYFRNQEE